MMPAAITPCELRRISHRRPSGSVKLHSWITVLGQQGAEPDLRMYAVVHRCERICAILQTRPQGSLCSNQFQPLGSVFGQEGVELQTVQFLYSRAEGQISFRMQFGQSGLRALHVRRPCKIRRWEKIVQSSSGTDLMSSCSIFTGSLLSVRPSLPETRRTCVSTTMPSFVPNALPRTTLAVLRPTPGRATSSDIVRGTSPPCSSTRALAMARKERALLR